jgi:HNH endonuclease
MRGIQNSLLRQPRVELDTAMANPLCFLCDVEITRENDSREHIIQSAIGGRRRIPGISCSHCNSLAGKKWDATAADQLKFLALHLAIRRDRGETRPGDYTTLSGQPVRLYPDGHLTFQRSAPDVTNRGSSVEIRARVTTRQEAQKLLQGFKRHYPKLDVEEALQGMVEEQNYLPESVGAVCNFGGPQSGRSVVKSAFALAVASGVVPQTCSQARAYLKSENGEPCFGHYYERDHVTNRPIDRVFHCVAIKGDPTSGRLFGYVELFSTYRMIVGLSDQYCGAPLFSYYAIDPTSSEELKLDFDLSLVDDELRAAISNQHDHTSGLVKAFQSALAIAQSRSFAREQRRAAEAAWTGAIAKLGLSQGQEVTPDIAIALSHEIVLRMQPFLDHFISASRPPTVARPQIQASPESDS